MDIRNKYIEIIEGMKSESKLVQWDTMIKWCKLWIEVEKKEVKPLLDLIIILKEFGFWDRYYPSQSHRALGISVGKNYTERYELSMVYINYNIVEDNFSIQYQKGQGGETIKTECGSKVSQENLNQIELWLNNKNNKRSVK